MKPPAFSTPGAPPKTGSALLITLAVLVLLSVLIVGLNDLMRVERGAAHSHLEKARAELLAQGAQAKVVARLQQAFTDPRRPWISQPGQLLAGKAADLSDPYPRRLLTDPPILLHSGKWTAASVPAVFEPAELNPAAFEPPDSEGRPAHLLTNEPNVRDPARAVRMTLRWIYVRKDGTEDFEPVPAADNAQNPLVGRYAFWTDDESAKVNYNLAWTRGPLNPNTAGHSSKVHLPAVLANGGAAEQLASALHFYNAAPRPSLQPVPNSVAAYRSINRFFFPSPADARQVDAVAPGLSAAFDAAKFSLTHYNHSPNWPSLVLTTSSSRADNRSFLAISATGGEDLGDWSRISPGRLAETISQLNSILGYSEWPTVSGASFADKFHAGDKRALTQLSLNIIDYVRSKESAQPIVVPLRGSLRSNGSFSLGTLASPDSFAGISRAPRITEMALFIPEAPVNGKTYAAKLKVEVHLPANFGIPSLSMAGLFLSQELRVDDGPGANTLSLALNPPESAVTAAEANPPILLAGGFSTITRTVAITYENGRPTRQSIAALRVAISLKAGSDRLDIAPLREGAENFARCPVNLPGVGESQISSIEVDDPRINSHRDDWKPAAKNSLGAANSLSSLGRFPSAAVLPEQDVDRLGKITDISLVMPAPKGTAGNTLCSNPNGIMVSTGELGFLSTGMAGAAKAGVPWRTLRLQPGRQGIGVVPDWALLDVFGVPDEASFWGHNNQNGMSFTYFPPPNTHTIPGRININAQAVPFELDRVLPLAALLQGARTDAGNLAKTMSAAEARLTAAAIHNRTTAARGKPYGARDAYDSKGEIVEIRGVADTGEASEELVREIADLITVRGNVLSVYSIGQALRQTPSGTVVVTGENRQQVMIERVFNLRGPGPFRPVFSRPLPP